MSKKRNLKEMTEESAKFDAKLKEIKASFETMKANHPEEEKVSISQFYNMFDDVIDYIDRSLSSIRSDVWDLYDNLYKHEANGHIPKITGAKDMQKVLDVLGLADDYEVKKKIIYSNASKNGRFPEVSVSMEKVKISE